ncbi:hypothetical protein, partial [Acinetobacter gerneri]|uniref:hypothetical protein n=1 Tax=Acinetobacter gerneri TaxID=202952 RepID=UPI0005A743BF
RCFKDSRKQTLGTRRLSTVCQYLKHSKLNYSTLGAFLLPEIRMNRAQRADAQLNIGSDDL